MIVVSHINVAGINVAETLNYVFANNMRIVYIQITDPGRDHSYSNVKRRPQDPRAIFLIKEKQLHTCIC